MPVLLALPSSPAISRVGHLGVDGLLGLEHRREAVDARVGHIHHGGMHLDLAGRGAGRLGAARQGVEQGGFPRLREADDAEFHREWNTLTLLENLFILYVHCRSGGTGIRARLKIVFRKECGFNSHLRHQPPSLRGSFYFSGLDWGNFIIIPSAPFYPSRTSSAPSAVPLPGCGGGTAERDCGESWPDIKILNELGKALGHAEHFWEDYHQALDEVLAPAGMNYEQFKKGGVLKGKEIYQKYKANGFKTPSKKVELFSDRLKQWGFDPLPTFSELSPVSLEYPLLATSRKNPYYFHSAFRQISALRKKHPDPIMDIHPTAAGIIGLTEGDWALIITPKGRIEQKVHLSESLDPRVVFLDYGWWFPEEKVESLFDWDRSNLNILTAGEPFDPAMGTPNLRAFPCRIEKCPPLK